MMPEPVALSKNRCSSTESGGAVAQPARPAAKAMTLIAMEMLLMRVTASSPDQVRRIAGTPRPIIDRLNLALRHALADPKVKEAFDKNAMDLYPADQETPEIASAMLKSEIKRWGDVIRANKITAQ